MVRLSKSNRTNLLNDRDSFLVRMYKLNIFTKNLSTDNGNILNLNE